MGDHLSLSLLDWLDLLALATCLGTLSCRLWVLPPRCTLPDTGDAAVFHAPLQRLLAVGLAGLTASSGGTLIGQAMSMSGLALPALLPVLPKVLFHTHFGRMWLIRVVVLAALWMGWWTDRKHLHVRAIAGLLLLGGALIALTRSVSGHAADWGDLTPSELIDWLHLLAALLWAGGLLSLASIVLPVARRVGAQQRTLIADIARRFSVLAGTTLMVTVPTGLYNAWLQVGSFQALWATPYGRTLLAKLLLLLPLLTLGASNHYVTVPLLQLWAGRPLPPQRLLFLSCVRRFLIVDRRKSRKAQLVQQLQRKVGAEIIIVAGALLCTAFLVQGVPARHRHPAYSGALGIPMYHQMSTPFCVGPLHQRAVLSYRLQWIVQLPECRRGHNLRRGLLLDCQPLIRNVSRRCPVAKSTQGDRNDTVP